MALLFENFGLEMMNDDEKLFEGIVGMSVSEGKAIMGYHMNPYIFKALDSPEIWTETKKDETGKYEIVDVNTHCGGMVMWDLVHSGMDVTPTEVTTSKKDIIFNQLSGKGSTIPVEIINPDILPSLMEDDVVRAQVVALPLSINYYLDEEAYEDAQAVDFNGKKLSLGDGSLMALDMLSNHTIGKDEDSGNKVSDSFVSFRATVKKLYRGYIDINGDRMETFIKCFADTICGELEFVHTLEQIPEEQRENIKVGAVISGKCIISGDVAVNEYAEGMVKDFEHDLRALRYSFVKGDAERLRSIISKDATYKSDLSEKSFSNLDQIIEWMNYVFENKKSKIYAHLATIAEADNLDYEAGTRCIILASGDENSYDSIVFITVNENGIITDITLTNDSRYRFKIDDPVVVKTIFDDIELPKSVSESIILRAKYIGALNEGINEENLVKNLLDYHYLENNAEALLNALHEDGLLGNEEVMSNVFGYLFAKAMEYRVNKGRISDNGKFICAAHYSVDDAINGNLNSVLSVDENNRLEKALEDGKSFYTDVKVFSEVNKLSEEEFNQMFMEAGILVQRIGEIASVKYVDDNGLSG